MPVRVEHRGSQWCVVKVENGDIEKCYDNSEEANKYASALNIAHARAKGYVHGERPLEDDIKQDLREMNDI